MTISDEQPSGSAPTGRRGPPSRRRVIVAVGVIVLAVAATAAALIARHVHRNDLDRSYGPIDEGSSAGPRSLHNVIFSSHGFSMRLAPAAEAVQFIETIENRGSHSVVITAIPAGGIVTDVRWSIYSTDRTHNGLGDPEPWRRFPAVVPADDQIRLLVTIHHPADCAGRNAAGAGGTFYVGEHEIRWESLLHHHSSYVRFPASYGIRVC